MFFPQSQVSLIISNVRVLPIVTLCCKDKDGRERCSQMYLSGTTKWWYHRLEEPHDCKNAENQGETATANALPTWDIINFTILLCYIYCNIYEVTLWLRIF
jgi:hypothetical protein